MIKIGDVVCLKSGSFGATVGKIYTKADIKKYNKFKTSEYKLDKNIIYYDMYFEDFEDGYKKISYQKLPETIFKKHDTNNSSVGFKK